MPGPVVYGKRQLAERQRAGRAPPLQVKGKKHRMNLDHIRYFQAIAYYEHYGRAAQALHVSQPNLNYAVTQLENELGVPLFEKHGRGVQLTRYGRLFLQSVNESLRILDAGTRDLQEMGRGGGLVLLGGIRKLPLAVHDRAGHARPLQIINFFDEFHQKHIFVFIIRRYYNKVKSVR